MNKLIRISSLTLIASIMLGCGSEEAKTTTDVVKTKVTEEANKVVEKATEAVKKTVAVSPEMTEKAKAVADAKMITKAFGGALKSELKAAMKTGGPINALDVCNTKAGPIAAGIQKEKNASVSRVSLKNRNSDNVPNDWQKTVLEDFDARAAKGEDVVKMAYAEIVENNGKKQLHFMKALPVGDVCLKCHGSNIKPEVQAKISELYPDDKATGYSKGQVRGAVVIVKDIN